MAETAHEFLQRVKLSGVIHDSTAVASALEAAEQTSSSQAAAELLLQRRLLTEFQTRVLLDHDDIPLSIGEYVVTDKLGRGGMGYVLKARHRRMHRDVAIKFLRPEFTASEDLRRRFDREVRAAAVLHHQNIVTAYDAGEHSNGCCYLVMQYVAGDDLAQLVKKLGPLPIPKTIDLIRQAAEGLAFAHEKGIVHRDIKPGNLLLDHDGVVRILDLGLARMRTSPGDSMQGESESDLTASGNMMGTVEYMAPEQALDAKAVDHRADIYSLGCTLYFLLTSRPPYRGSTMMRCLLSHRDDEIPSLCALNARVPQELDDILRRMLAKAKEDRFASMRQLVEVLKKVPLQELGDEPIARPERYSGPEFDPTLDHQPDPAETGPLPLAPHQIADAKPISAGASRIPGMTEREADSSLDATISTEGHRAISPGTPASKPSTSRRLFVGGLSIAVGVVVAGVVMKLPDLKDSSSATSQHQSEGSASHSTDQQPAELNVDSTDRGPSDLKDSTPDSERAHSNQPAKPDPIAALKPVEILRSDLFTWSEPKHLGPAVNSPGRDTSPVLTADERLMLFARDGVIWQARREDGNAPFESAEPLPGAFNNSQEPVGHEGISITGDGLELFFTSRRGGLTNDEIWQCKRAAINEPFGEPRLLSPVVNSKWSDRGAVVSPDGLRMWITAARNSATSGDVFEFSRVSRQVDFDQEHPVGPDLNSTYWDAMCSVTSDLLGLVKTEQSPPRGRCVLHVRSATTEFFGPPEPFGPVPMGRPFVSANGRRVYFHSRELPNGHGELDLYVVERIRKPATE